VISAQNANRPKGQISDEDTIADVTANDQISKARDYAPLVIASRNNSVAKLSDIATITDSVENVRSVAYVNGKESVSLLVYCSPGANVISTVDENQAPTAVHSGFHPFKPAASGHRRSNDHNSCVG